GPSIVGLSVPVDIAADAFGTLAIVSAGNDQVFVTTTQELDELSGPFSCMGGDQQVQVPGQPIAVASVPDAVNSRGAWLVQTRERPAADEQGAAVTDKVATLSFTDQSGTVTESIQLSTLAENMKDTGHYLFHHDASQATRLACASCHPEGHEDG